MKTNHQNELQHLTTTTTLQHLTYSTLVMTDLSAIKLKQIISI